MPRWTFLSNHAVVLSFLGRHPRITAQELAAAIGVTERTIRKIISDLHAAGYIGKEKEGRRICYHINADLPLRHHTHRDVLVGRFLEALGWRKTEPAPEPEGQVSRAEVCPESERVAQDGTPPG